MARIDDSHQPFKRTKTIGPGPRRRPAIQQAKDWECAARPSTRTHYIHVCTYVGPNRKRRGKKVTIKTSKAAKKAYNKQYRKWRKRNRTQLAKRRALPGYRCHRTKYAKCR